MANEATKAQREHWLRAGFVQTWADQPGACPTREMARELLALRAREERMRVVVEAVRGIDGRHFCDRGASAPGVCAFQGDADGDGACEWCVLREALDALDREDPPASTDAREMRALWDAVSTLDVAPGMVWRDPGDDWCGRVEPAPARTGHLRDVLLALAADVGGGEHG